MMKLSLILPIFNVEKYLSKCFNSIYAQNLEENKFEVIAVIDGSPDRSIDIVKEFSKLHTNLVIIDKENGGVSSARNEGIKIAKGEYIMFIDPDDTLIANSLREIYSSLEKIQSDIYILRSYKETNSEQFVWKNILEANTLYTGKEVYKKGYTRGGVWGVVYNRAFLFNYKIEFPLNIKNSEDAFFFMRCQINAKKIVFLDIDTYLLFTRSDSASQDMNIERIIHWFNTLNLLKSYKNNDANSAIEISMADGLIYSVISDITKNSIKTMGWSARRFLLKHNIKDYLPICNENLRNSRKANYIMKKLINYSFTVFFLISYIRYK